MSDQAAQRAREIMRDLRLHPGSEPAEERTEQAIAAALREADDTARREIAGQLTREHFELTETLRARLETTLAQLAAAQAENEQLRGENQRYERALYEIANRQRLLKIAGEVVHTARAALAPRDTAGG